MGAHSLNATRFTCIALTLRRFQRFIGTHTAQNMQLRSKLMLSVAALALFGLSQSSASSPDQLSNAARLLQGEGPRTTGTCAGGGVAQRVRRRLPTVNGVKMPNGPTGFKSPYADTDSEESQGPS